MSSFYQIEIIVLKRILSTIFLYLFKCTNIFNLQEIAINVIGTRLIKQK